MDRQTAMAAQSHGQLRQFSWNSKHWKHYLSTNNAAKNTFNCSAVVSRNLLLLLIIMRIKPKTEATKERDVDLWRASGNLSTVHWQVQQAADKSLHQQLAKAGSLVVPGGSLVVVM
jgi:hypothetical protein